MCGRFSVNAWCWSDRLGRRRKSVRIMGLADFPLILPGLPHSNRRLIEQVAAQSGFHLNVIFDVGSVSLTKRMVAEGMGYSILARAAVPEDIAQGAWWVTRLNDRAFAPRSR